MKQLQSTYNKLEGRLQAEGFKTRVLRTLKAWEDSIYHKDYMNKLHNVFLGLEVESNNPVLEQLNDLDGDPLQEQAETDEDVPMDGAALLKMRQTYRSPSGDSDLDGT